MQLTKFGVNAILKLNSLRALKVLMILAENSNDNGESNITLVKIAEEIDVAHKSNISSSLKELEELNFIAIDNKKKRNIYILNPDYFITQSPYPVVLEKFNKIRTKRIKEKEKETDIFDEFNVDKLLDEFDLGVI